MLEDNKDICPNVDFDALYPAATPVIRNQLVKDAFELHETAACKARNTYIRLGSTALVFVLSGALFTVIDALVIQYVSVSLVFRHYLGVAFAIIVSLGLAIQYLLYVSKTKQKWLSNRFAAERLRSIKFQAFAIAIDAKNENDFEERVEKFTRGEIAILNQEMNASHSLLFDSLASELGR